MTACWSRSAINNGYTLLLTVTQTRKCHNVLCVVLRSTGGPHYLSLWYSSTHMCRAKFFFLSTIRKNSLLFYGKHLWTTNFSIQTISIFHASTIFSHSSVHDKAVACSLFVRGTATTNLALINQYLYIYIYIYFFFNILLTVHLNIFIY